MICICINHLPHLLPFFPYKSVRTSGLRERPILCHDGIGEDKGGNRMVVAKRNDLEVSPFGVESFQRSHESLGARADLFVRNAIPAA